MESVQVVPRIIELFDSTCLKQFQIMGCEVVAAGACALGSLPASNEVSISSIEALNADLTLKLHVSCSRSFLERTMPVESQNLASDTSLQDDWNSELANRFICRMKNKLIFHGCNLKMGLPKVLRTSTEDVPSDLIQRQSGIKKITRCYEIKNGAVNDMVECCIWLDVHNKEMVLCGYEDEDEDWFPESELEHL